MLPQSLSKFRHGPVPLSSQLVTQSSDGLSLKNNLGIVN